MDQGQRQANCDGRKGAICPRACHAQDNDQENRGQRDLGHKNRDKTKTTRRGLAKAIGCKPACACKAGLTGQDQPQKQPCKHRTYDLGNPVDHKISGPKPACQCQTQSDRWVEVPTGNRPDRIGHRKHSQTKGETDAKPTDAHIRRARRKNGAAAPAKDQNKRTQGLCQWFLKHLNTPSPVATKVATKPDAAAGEKHHA